MLPMAKSPNTKQYQAGLSTSIMLSTTALPGCITLLPKDSKIKWFWLIIAAYPPLQKVDSGWSSVYLLKKLEG